jgi:hypothetical protein
MQSGLRTPEKRPRFHAGGEFEIATDLSYGFYGFGAGDVAGEEDVVVV